MGDLNNDELMDLIVGNSEGSIFCYLNTGSKKTAMFTTQKELLYLGCNNVGASPFLADLNTDGLMDLIVGSGVNVLYFANTGTITNPVFTASQILGVSNPFDGINSTSNKGCSPSLVDLNSDSKLDLILGNGAGKIQYYINTGTLPIHSAFTDKNLKMFLDN